MKVSVNILAEASDLKQNNRHLFPTIFRSITHIDNTYDALEVYLDYRTYNSSFFIKYGKIHSVQDRNNIFFYNLEIEK